MSDRWRNSYDPDLLERNMRRWRGGELRPDIEERDRQLWRIGFRRRIRERKEQQ